MSIKEKNILIVNDDASKSKGIKLILDFFGYSCQLATVDFFQKIDNLENYFTFVIDLEKNLVDSFLSNFDTLFFEKNRVVPVILVLENVNQEITSANFKNIKVEFLRSLTSYNEIFQVLHECELFYETESKIYDGYKKNRHSSTTNDQIDLSKDGIDLKQYLHDLELNYIKQALNECHGVVAHAAERLKMRRTTLVEKMRKYGIARTETVTDE